MVGIHIFVDDYIFTLLISAAPEQLGPSLSDF